jgi:hypothetical protein
MSGPEFNPRDDEQLEQCESTMTINSWSVVRCQQPKGHSGDHSASWDWEDAPPLEKP